MLLGDGFQSECNTTDESLFLFSIKRNDNIKPRKCNKITKIKDNTYSSSNVLFGIGSGCDLEVSVHCDGKGSTLRTQPSYLHPESFQPIDPGNRPKQFVVDEMEVFQILLSDDVTNSDPEKERKKSEKSHPPCFPSITTAELLTHISGVVNALTTSIANLAANPVGAQLVSELQKTLS